MCRPLGPACAPDGSEDPGGCGSSRSLWARHRHRCHRPPRLLPPGRGRPRGCSRRPSPSLTCEGSRHARSPSRPSVHPAARPPASARPAAPAVCPTAPANMTRSGPPDPATERSSGRAAENAWGSPPRGAKKLSRPAATKPEFPRPPAANPQPWASKGPRRPASQSCPRPLPAPAAAPRRRTLGSRVRRSDSATRNRRCGWP
mmetsp:Transcript_74119/g.240993  ORF Transcript_74119/g.240993 Transcript_74119/m.240993 type:complete len:202 (+) Transcript_74119:734-1339(+)